MTAIPFIVWRDGRPRFVPSPKLRKEGHKGHDLKHPDGTWFSRGEALDWSDAFCARIEADEAREKKTVKRKAKAAAPAEKAAPAMPQDPVSYPISQLWHDWLASPRTRELSAQTQENYLRRGRTLEDFDPELWASEVTALDGPICNGLYEALWADRGQTTANDVLTALGAAIAWGRLSGKVRGLPENPAHRLRKKKRPPRVRFGTREEIEAMVEAADALCLPEIGDMVWLGVWMGQRQADRLRQKITTLLATVTPMRQKKTGAIVAIPAADLLRKRLEAALARRKKAGHASDYAVLNESTWEPFTDRWQYNKVWLTVRRVAARKVPSVETLQDKDLRATCVTWLALAGCSHAEIASITGHEMSSVNDILKHYLAMHPELARSAIAKMVIWWDNGGVTQIAV